ncbi:hypothetical protein ACOMHN_023842 [Nucella lapillus]
MKENKELTDKVKENKELTDKVKEDKELTDKTKENRKLTDKRHHHGRIDEPSLFFDLLMIIIDELVAGSEDRWTEPPPPRVDWRGRSAEEKLKSLAHSAQGPSPDLDQCRSSTVETVKQTSSSAPSSVKQISSSAPSTVPRRHHQ